MLRDPWASAVTYFDPILAHIGPWCGTLRPCVCLCPPASIFASYFFRSDIELLLEILWQFSRSATFIWGAFHKRYISHQSIKWAGKLFMQNVIRPCWGQRVRAVNALSIYLCHLYHKIQQQRGWVWRGTCRECVIDNAILPSNLSNKTHLSMQLNCWSLRCSWSIACRRCSKYIFILNTCFNGLGRDNCNTRRESFKVWDLVRLILDIFGNVAIVPGQY